MSLLQILFITLKGYASERWCNNVKRMFTEANVNGLTFFKRLFYQHFNSQIKAHVLVLNSLSIPPFEVSSTPCSGANIFPGAFELLSAKGQLKKKERLNFPCASHTSHLEPFLEKLSWTNHNCKWGLKNLVQRPCTVPSSVPIFLCQPALTRTDGRQGKRWYFQCILSKCSGKLGTHPLGRHCPIEIACEPHR